MLIVVNVVSLIGHDEAFWSCYASGAKMEQKAEKQGWFGDELTGTIVDLEVNKDGWTLMHRFNKAAELIHKVQ